MSGLLIIPRATEKAYAQSLATNTYVFSVPLDANKQQIIDAALKNRIIEFESGKIDFPEF